MQGQKALNSLINKKFYREYRLTNSSQFEQVFKQGRRRKDRYFVVIALTTQTVSSRLGLAISKRRAARAVDRNRIKRIARESFRHNRSELPGLDIVVLATGLTRTASNETLHASLSSHWQALGQALRGNQNHG